MLLAAATLSIALWALQVWHWPAVKYFMFDLNIYHQAGADVIAGGSLYQDRFLDHPFTYTPFAGILCAGLSLMSMESARLFLATVTIGCLGVAAFCSVRVAGIRPGRRATTVAVAIGAIGLWSEPVQDNLTFGQVNVVLMALVLLDFALPDSFPGKGVAIGLATAIKLTPGLFVVYLLMTRRFRPAATSSVTMAATMALGFLVLPADSSRYWSGIFADSGRVGDRLNSGNQSLYGLLGHLGLTGAVLTTCWLLCAALVGYFGSRAAIRSYRRADELGGVLVCALTALLVSPISWIHHWVWMTPLLAWLLARTESSRLAGRRSRWLPLCLTVVLFECWPQPGSQDWPMPLGAFHWHLDNTSTLWTRQLLLAVQQNMYALFAILVLIVVVRADRRATRPETSPPRQNGAPPERSPVPELSRR